MAPSADEVPYQALERISNWRACHAWPLNTFKIWLLDKAAQIDNKSVVAQRLKRLPSIAAKLRRFPKMRLSQMQDIAGCRAIVSSVSNDDRLVRRYKKSDLKHLLVHEDDYILEPRPSGYRGVHLVYRYYSDKTETYNDLKVEVQLRSALQHAWATAVETVGMFTQQALKSSQGHEEWLRFFKLMGAEMAFREHTPPVPNTTGLRTELRDQLRHLVSSLDVENHLRLYAEALKLPERAGEIKGAKFFLLELDVSAMRLRITGYRGEELERANRDYTVVERSTIGDARDAVLVSVDSFRSLKRAYPNYYLDTHRFISAVRRAVGPPPRKYVDPRQLILRFPEYTSV